MEHIPVPKHRNPQPHMVKHIKDPDHMPRVEHFAALVFTSIKAALSVEEKLDPDRGYDHKDKRIVEYVVFPFTL